VKARKAIGLSIISARIFLYKLSWTLYLLHPLICSRQHINWVKMTSFCFQ